MGKPFFTVELKTNKKLLDRLSMLPTRARRNIFTLIRTELVPALEERARTLSEDMPMPSSPFAFGTVMTGPVLQLSRKYYFWLIGNNPGLSDGEHWIRRYVIESGWQFTAVDRVQQIQIRGRNAEPKARYVFGPWAVQGHINTGWVAKGEEIRADLQAYMRSELKRMWSQAVRAALEGQG